jgi:hypothetical protein
MVYGFGPGNAACRQARSASPSNPTKVRSPYRQVICHRKPSHSVQWFWAPHVSDSYLNSLLLKVPVRIFFVIKGGSGRATAFVTLA